MIPNYWFPRSNSTSVNWARTTNGRCRLWFYSLKNERTIRGMGVTRVAVPSRNTKSSERRNLQRARWFKAGQRWRTGCEGRISVLKRRHGLNRCRYRGFEGMQRWVGLG